MKLDENMRTNVENIKAEEKKQAIETIFGESQEQSGKLLLSESKAPEVNSKASKKANEIWANDEEVTESKTEARKGPYTDQIRAGDIEETAVEKSQVVREVPAVRAVVTQEPIKLDFTERLFPTLALRESQFKEAPAPKLRKLAQKFDKNPENTLKSPIWLKDKGDEFLQAGDIQSALDAYNNAIRLDPAYYAAYSNRSICYLKLHNLDDCQTECNSLLAKMFELEKNDQMTGMLQRIREKVYLRCLVIFALKGEFGSYKELCQILLREKFLKDDSKELLVKDLLTIEEREKALHLKTSSDQLLKDGNCAEAAASYLQILNEHPTEQLNERLLSNLSLSVLKLDKLGETEEYCTKAIKLVENRLGINLSQPDKTKQNQYYKQMLVKLYYRRATCCQKSGRISEAEDDLRSILLIDERNEEARVMKRSIQLQRDVTEAAELKQQGDLLLKEGKHSNALTSYKQALTRLDQNQNPLDYLSVLLNMTVCHTVLEQVDDLISDCIKGLRIVDKYNKAVIKFEKDQFTAEEKTRLAAFELRFFIRRGNAFLKKGQIYHAKADFEAALKLAPDNKEVRQSLDKLATL